MEERQPLESQRDEWKVGELLSKSDVLVRSSDGARIQAQHQGLFGTQEMIRFIPPPTSGGVGSVGDDLRHQGPGSCCPHHRLAADCSFPPVHPVHVLPFFPARIQFLIRWQLLSQPFALT